MAASKVDTASLSARIIEDARRGVFAPVYLLMGDEPYYPDLVCGAILDSCVDEACRDFNETVCYGSDVTAEQVITAARRFPMMSDRQIVVVRDAHLMKDVEQLSLYCADPVGSTVLVLLMRKASADKRKALYKAVQKCGVVLDSPQIRDYEMPRWIEGYYRSRGLAIEPRAAVLLSECIGTDLGAIVMETDKLLKNLPQGSGEVRVADVERNVGVSRQFTVFELCKALSERNGAEAFKIAYNLGGAAKFAMPAATSALYMYFNRILRYGALLSRGPVSSEDKAKALAGVNPYFYREYDTAVRNYPLKKAMAVISLLCEYDYLGKGGDGGAASPSDLLVELTAKILTI